MSTTDLGDQTERLIGRGRARHLGNGLLVAARQRAERNYGLGPDDVDLLVVTDAEAILAIGDWGMKRVRDLGRQARGLHRHGRGSDPDRILTASPWGPLSQLACFLDV